MRRMLWLVPLAVVLAVSGVALFTSAGSARLGAPAPAFSLPTLDDPDTDLALGDLRGGPVVINFWASWCEPCRDEAPAFARIAAETPAVTFLGINILDGRDDAQAYVDEFGLPFQSVRDARGVVSKRYGVNGVPETVFVDADGNLVGVYIGAITADQLERLVTELAALEPDETLRITGSGESRPVP